MLSIWNGYSRTEIITLLFVAVVAVVMGVAFLAKRTSPTNRNAIAVVTLVENDARAKLSDSLTWFDNDVGTALPEETAVYSGAGSRTHLEMKDGSRIELGENTLVVLRSRNGPEIDVSFGMLNTNLPPHAKLRIRNGRRVINLDGAVNPSSVVIRKAEGKLEIFSASGEVYAETEGHREAIGETPIAYNDSPLPEHPAPLKPTRIPRALAALREVRSPSVSRAPAAVEIPREEAKSIAPVLPAKKPKGPPNLFVALGAGLNYLNFAQTGVEVQNIEYASAQGPSYSFLMRAQVSDAVAIEGVHSSQPGKIKSSQVSVTNANFNWSYQSLEAIYGMPSGFTVRGGFQRHTLPYLQVVTLTRLEVRDYTQTMASIGAGYAWKRLDKWRPQVFLRYQVPIAFSESNGDQLQNEARFAFDGSLGVNRILSRNFTLGMFWYGQWHEYDYSMFNPSTGLPDSGQSKYFFSNLELRLEYGF